MPRAARRRLPAEEAQRRILDAAEKRLVETGPEGLRLVELAKELGISHPAILHHFGSREGLVRAVVERAMSTLNGELIAAFASTLQKPAVLEAEELLPRIAETLADRGQARLLAWLILAGERPPELQANVRLTEVARGAHALRAARTARDDIPFEDTMFFVQLTAYALLADAVFGDALRRFEAKTDSPLSAREFQARLSALLQLHLDAAPQSVSSRGKDRSGSRSRRR